MSASNLRAIFSADPVVRISAERIFANRVDEMRCFDDSVVATMAKLRAEDRSVVDLDSPRRNVLVYYGIGGIGKTALSRRLERRVLDWELSDDPPARATARMNFEDGTSFDPETFVLHLRVALSPLGSDWTAFDLAFGVYWERAHPGQRLIDFMRENPILGAAGDTAMYNQMTAALERLPRPRPKIIYGSDGDAPISVYDRVEQAIAQDGLLNDCPYFRALTAAEPNDETLSYLPSLLAWDLDRQQRRTPTLAVIFLDTYEAVTGRFQREVERTVQRALYLLPNALFVLTGRNRLNWADAGLSDELDYVGTDRWPLLSASNLEQEPRQHLVGYLSEVDCDAFLTNALRIRGAPDPNPEIKRVVVQASRGLPLYLDLAVTHYLHLVATGIRPGPEEFGGPLRSVVTRILRDMGPEERQVVRGLTILDAFDRSLAESVAADVSATAVQAVLARPFIEKTTGETWPYSMHALLRESIRQVDAELRDKWSAREWRNAAARACQWFGEESTQPEVRRDRMRLSSFFLQAARISGEFGVACSWLVDVGRTLAEMGSWSTLAAAPNVVRPDTGVAALVQGFRGMALRRSGSLEASIAELESALASAEIEPGAAELFSLHRAHSVRNSGRYDEAEEIYAAIVADAGSHSVEARVQLADLNLLRGRFHAALDGLRTLPEEAYLRGESLRIRGHVHRVNADFDTAEGYYRRADVIGHEMSSASLSGKVLTNVAETLCWHRPSEAVAIAERAAHFNEGVGNKLEVTKAYSALTVAAAAAGDHALADRAFSRAREVAISSGYRAGEVFALVGHAYHHLLHGQDDLARDSLREIDEIVHQIGVYAYWPVIVRVWLGDPDPYATPGRTTRPLWLATDAEIRTRWHAVLRLSG
jgi:tetratricopeptide (TPR) repeat protein